MATKNELIGTKALEEIIETAIFTGHLYDTIPVSLMLIGPSGAGKSKMLLKFQGEMLHRSDDVTSSGLQNIMQLDEKEQAISHIVLPDFNAPLSHKPATSTLLVANLLTMMSDGTARIDDGREVKTMKHNPIGILTAVTPEMYSKNEYKWKVLGFKRRFLPIFYDYTRITIQKAQDQIRKGKVTSEPLTEKRILFKDGKAVVKLGKREAQTIQDMSLYLAECLAIQGTRKRDEDKKIKHEIVPGKTLLPYSPHLLLQAFARGNALKCGRRIVLKKDISFCEDLLTFCRYGEPKRL